MSLHRSFSLFRTVETAPRDPTIGITDMFNADTNPNKINLGVGVYCDENGKVPLLNCVRAAEAVVRNNNAPRTYLPIDGLPRYGKAVQELLFGRNSTIIEERRAITVQAIGGTGALKLGADLLKRFFPDSRVWVSDPTWDNHRALFESAGFVVNSYPYYEMATHGVNFAGMLNILKMVQPRDVVLLHACCHNPTGADLTDEEWIKVVQVLRARNAIAFLDMAYQGFGESVETDGKVGRLFAEAGVPLFISNSFSKSFSLYGERVGALSIVTTNVDEATRLLSQLKIGIRTNYSNPPAHGGQIVETILVTKELHEMWQDELAEMRARIHDMRRKLVQSLKEKLPGHDFNFVIKQRGMFSYSGLSKDQVTRLRDEFSIYAIDTGRICIAALNTHNIDAVVAAIAEVSG